MSGTQALLQPCCKSALVSDLRKLADLQTDTEREREREGGGEQISEQTTKCSNEKIWILMLLKEDEQTQVFYYLLLRDTSLGGICKANNKPKTEGWSLWRESSHESPKLWDSFFLLAVEDDHLAVCVGGPIIVCLHSICQGGYLFATASPYRVCFIL